MTNATQNVSYPCTRYRYCSWSLCIPGTPGISPVAGWLLLMEMFGLPARRPLLPGMTALNAI